MTFWLKSFSFILFGMYFLTIVCCEPVNQSWMEECFGRFEYFCVNIILAYFMADVCKMIVNDKNNRKMNENEY